MSLQLQITINYHLYKTRVIITKLDKFIKLVILFNVEEITEIILNIRKTIKIYLSCCTHSNKLTISITNLIYVFYTIERELITTYLLVH